MVTCFIAIRAYCKVLRHFTARQYNLAMQLEGCTSYSKSVRSSVCQSDRLPHASTVSCVCQKDSCYDHAVWIAVFT